MRISKILRNKVLFKIQIDNNPDHQLILMIKREKSKRGYRLNEAQRNIFLKKILPTLFVGSIIWLAAELVFSYTFQNIQLSGIFLIIYIIAIIGEVGLFIGIYFLSKHNKKVLSLVLYLIFSYLAGLVSLPIAIYTEFLTQVHMIVSLTVGANLIVILMGLTLRQKYFAGGHFWEHFFIFLIGLALIEIVFLIVFKIHNLLTVPLTLSYLCTIALPIIFYGAKVIRKNDDAPWIFMFAKIQGIMLLSLIIAVVIVIIVLLIIAIAILAGDANVDLSGISITGGSRKKKKSIIDN